MRISVFGLGNMGRAFATRALQQGHTVTVWNRTPGRAAELVAAGATEADSPGAAASGVDVVLVVLTDADAVLGVCLGDKGALAALGPEAVLANISTVGPDTARQLAEAGPAGRVLDAPVLGSPDMIAAGLGGFLIGGEPGTVAALDRLWHDLGSGYTHCGPSGAGAIMKLVSNLLLVAGVTALAEGIATARHHGIADDLIRDLFSQSFVVSPASQVRLDTLMNPDHPGWFSAELARKDVRLAVGLAEESGVPVAIGPATEALLTRAIETGVPWPDFSSVIEALS